MDKKKSGLKTYPDHHSRYSFFSITLTTFLLYRNRALSYRRLQNWGITIARNLSYDSELAVLAADRAQLQTLAEGVLREEDVTYCQIEDSNGNILVWSGASPSRRDTQEPESITNSQAGILAYRSPGGAINWYEIRVPVTMIQEKPQKEDLAFLGRKSLAADRSGEKAIIGEVTLGVSATTMNREISQIHKMTIAISAFTIMLGVLAMTFLAKVITRPINNLLEGTRLAAGGDLNSRIKTTSFDEVGMLTRSFNQMTVELQTSHRELEKYSKTLENKVAERTRSLSRANRDLQKSLKDLRNSQESLIQAEKFAAIGQLLTSITHEINNKLAPILGYAELLQMQELDDESQKMLKVIEDATLGSKEIINSLLAFARPRELSKSYQNINRILDQTLELLDYRMKASGVVFKSNLDKNLPLTMVDGTQISQVFLNIINNAQQAMEKSKKKILSITSREEDGFIKFRFTDSGEGMTHEVQKRIFDPFFSTKRPGKGSGLGLSVSYQIVKSHGGSIEVESKKGDGASFTVYLPIEEGKIELPAPFSQLPHRKADIGARILIVDDEENIVTFIRSVLCNSYQVDIAKRGETALKKLDESLFDLLLVDLRMPGVNGKDIYTWLKDNKPGEEKKIVFMTGDTFDPRARDFIRTTGNPIMFKPFTIAQLLKEVERRLEVV
ncbi:MAG: ATP-binding protein [Candidatus Euphemobacter frigidus]|nr:ATP-binding protein [Candidatus Euphemobacter frigidus]MDP8275965.1 ATP-binding protein [Candidatus Euphemobacter frigidus]